MKTETRAKSCWKHKETAVRNTGLRILLPKPPVPISKTVSVPGRQDRWWRLHQWPATMCSCIQAGNLNLGRNEAGGD